MAAALSLCFAGCWTIPSSQRSQWYLEHELEFQDAILWDVSFSPDGTRLVTACYDHTAQVWDARSGRKLKVLAGHRKAVQAACFSPDGSMLLTSSHGQVRVWDTQTYRMRFELPADRGRFSFDSSKIYTEGDGAGWRDGPCPVNCWDAANGKRLPYHEYLRVPSLRIRDKIELRLDDGVPDARIVVTMACPVWSTSQTIRVWDQASLRLLSTVDIGRSVPPHSMLHAAQISLDGTTCLLKGPVPDEWTAYRVTSGKVLSTVVDPNGCAYLSPDGRLLATYGRGHPRTVFLWDTRTGRRTTRLVGYDGDIRALAWSPDGTRLAGVGMAKYPVVWRRGPPPAHSTLQRRSDHVGSRGKRLRAPSLPDIDVNLPMDHEGL